MNKKLLSMMTVAAISAGGFINLAQADSGTISFAGNVENVTCSVTGLDVPHSFDQIIKADAQKVVNNGMVARFPVAINISGCPVGIDNVEVTYNYTKAAVGTDSHIHLGDTDFRGGVLILRKGNNNQSTHTPGSKTTYPISAGSGEVVFYPELMRKKDSSSTAANNIVAGAFTGTVDLTLSFN